MRKVAAKSLRNVLLALQASFPGNYLRAVFPSRAQRKLKGKQNKTKQTNKKTKNAFLRLKDRIGLKQARDVTISCGTDR